MELTPEQWAPDQKGGTSFTFLAVEPQNERPRLSAGVRKQMKSHLTLLQHKRTRQERAAKISGWLKSSLGRDVNHGEEGNSTPRASPCLLVKRESPGQSSAESEGRPESVETAMRRKIWKLPSGVLEQAFSRGSMAFRTFALNDSANVIGSSLSRLQLDVSSVLRFYHAIVEFQTRDFADQFRFDHAVAFESFMSIVLRDPIPLTTALLITVRHLLLMKATPPTPRELYLEELMRGYLIRCVNAALDDPDRSVSDPLLVAVTLLAIYEVKYGNMSEYHIHMAGLVQMVNLRGGLAKINQKTKFVGYFIIWTDTNSSAIGQCDRYFDEWETSACYKADPDMFTIKDIHSQHADKRL